ncbi:hypothetical protein WICMUC_001182 [Wickerhamomyces mucosus]|uniref:Uncharacterized protein n=1 Tax=Wickerhamomyces mucosus TaxID=1378264 RepID=A0A9P8THN7_9ASCO|nr:hypothetical protein WICMUC_001182 [Wickerhamomyces mucosus]
MIIGKTLLSSTSFNLLLEKIPSSLNELSKIADFLVEGDSDTNFDLSNARFDDDGLLDLDPYLVDVLYDFGSDVNSILFAVIP